MRVTPLIARHGRSVLIVIVGIAISLFLVRLSEAGILSPSFAPASTMNTTKEIYDALASPSYDSSAIAPDAHGNAIQVSKCILLRMKGLSSPPDCP